MCIKLQKSLNPQAKEYRQQAPPPPPPMPLFSPVIGPHTLHISAPSPPQLVVPPPHTIAPQLVVHTIAPQLKLQPYLYHDPRPRHSINLTHYTECPPPANTTVPADLYLPKAADAAAPPVCTEASSASDPKQPTVKVPRRDDVIKKGPMRHLPPRIRRTLRSRAQLPPPPKQEWRRKNIAAAGGTADSPRPSMTTLMIKNVPNQLRREFMLKFLDGFSKTHSVAYDFFYLPIDFENPDNGNFGYAFVNFTTTAAANKMKKILNNYKWRGTYTENGEYFYSKKVCEMRWARVQGKEAQIRRFQMSKFNCSEEEFLPVVLDPPRNGSDPNPPPPVILGKLFPRGQ